MIRAVELRAQMLDQLAELLDVAWDVRRNMTKHDIHASQIMSAIDDAQGLIAGMSGIAHQIWEAEQ